MSQVFSDKVFYHIYALGMGNCPKRNDFACPAGDFFEKLAGRLDEIRALGCNALLIGPVFESTAHGYDTVDYYHVERRLGNNERFKEFCRLCHEKGFAVVLDAVFNKPEQHIHLLYGLLFTIPGIPSIYYGSEYGIRGVRSHNCDYELRPPLPPFGELPDFTAPGFDAGFIRTSITTFAKIRGQHPALQRGSYRQEFVANRQFGFWREYNEEKILIIVNADFAQGFVSLHSIPAGEYESLTDGCVYHSDALKRLQMPPCSILILRRK